MVTIPGYLSKTITKMVFKGSDTEHNGLLFKIEEDYPEVGAYLYVYKNGKCINDFLQNDVDACKEFAFEKYKIPIDKWTIK